MKEYNMFYGITKTAIEDLKDSADTWVKDLVGYNKFDKFCKEDYEDFKNFIKQVYSLMGE